MENTWAIEQKIIHVSSIVQGAFHVDQTSFLSAQMVPESAELSCHFYSSILYYWEAHYAASQAGGIILISRQEPIPIFSGINWSTGSHTDHLKANMVTHNTYEHCTGFKQRVGCLPDCPEVPPL